MRLSALERKVLKLIQEDIPFTSRPFRELSKRLGIKEELLLEKIKRLKEQGFIRNFSARVNHRKLNFKSTLVGLKVPLSRVNEIASKLSSLPEVTHCFLCKGRYNIWTVFIYKDGGINKLLRNLEKDFGKENILNLTTQKKFKLKTNLKI